MKELIFGRGLLDPTTEGRKRITIRKYRAESHDFQAGEIVKGIFMEGLTILLRITADTLTKPFRELADQEAQDDGFDNAEHAFEGLQGYYPDLTKEDLAGIIRFEVLCVDQEPVVQFNQYIYDD